MYLKVAERVDLKSYHHTHRQTNCVVMNVNQSYCGDHFLMSTNVKLLCCRPETYIMLCQLYLNKNKIKNKLDIKKKHIGDFNSKLLMPKSKPLHATPSCCYL